MSKDIHAYKIHSEPVRYLLIEKVYVGYVYFIYDKDSNVLKADCIYDYEGCCLPFVLKEIIYEHNWNHCFVETLRGSEFLEKNHGKDSV